MRTLFERLQAEGEAGLQRLIDEKQQEHVQLDFKRKSDPAHGSFNDDDKRTLSEALSGFSNSAGGLLIFGIDARKRDGIDCACDLAPIQAIEQFSSQTQTLAGQFLMPRHEGVEIAIIRTAADPAAGYLLVAIERSERRPHRSEAKGKKGYFKRMGDSFFEMEHYDIEDAFRRVSSANLDVEWDVTVANTYFGPDGTRKNAQLCFYIRNSAPTSAKFPYLSVGNLDGSPMVRFPGLGRDNIYGYIETIEQNWIHLTGGADIVINPGMRSIVFRIDVQINSDETSAVFINGRPLVDFEISFDYRVGCEDVRWTGGKMEVSGLAIAVATAG